jgi:hypothetical protein
MRPWKFSYAYRTITAEKMYLQPQDDPPTQFDSYMMKLSLAKLLKKIETYRILWLMQANAILIQKRRRRWEEQDSQCRDMAGMR